MLQTGSQPLVSVVLASYNHVHFVGEAVESVLNQGVDDIEVVVVDDGSTDGTVRLLKKFSDPRLRLILLAENRRRHPRNTALAVASGKYVAFQNSDDVWHRNKLEKQVEVMERDPGLSASFTGVEVIDEIGTELKHSWASNIYNTENRSSPAWLRYFFDKGNCVCVSSAMVRRNKLDEAGWFRESLIQLGDYDLWLRLAAVGGLHIIDDKLTLRRIVAGRNLSAPSGQSKRRAQSEHVECLGRYLENPLYKLLRDVFRDVLPAHDDSELACLGGLAIYAWKGMPYHVAFGNRIMATLLDDRLKREELCRIFGTGIVHEFIKKRGQIELRTI